jgi:hypothetical protein
MSKEKCRAVLKITIWIECLSEIINDNVVRKVKYAIHPKFWLSKLQCSHSKIFINLLRHPIMERFIFWLF